MTPGKTHRTVEYGEISESQELVTTPNKFHFQWSSAGCSWNGCNAFGFVCAQCMKFNDAQQDKSRRRAKSQGGGNGLPRESLRSEYRDEKGGLSGAPLRERALLACAEMYILTEVIYPCHRHRNALR